MILKENELFFDWESLEVAFLSCIVFKPTIIVQCEPVSHLYFTDKNIRKIYSHYVNNFLTETNFFEVSQSVGVSSTVIIELYDWGQFRIKDFDSLLNKLIDKQKLAKLRNFDLNSTDDLVSIKDNLLKILDTNLNNVQIKNIKEACLDSLEDLENKTSFKIGLQSLDNIIEPNGGKVVVIAGRPGGGKTSFALNIANNLIEQDAKVLFFSFEMNEKEISQKLMNINFDIDNFSDYAKYASEFLSLQKLENFSLLHHLGLPVATMEIVINRVNPDFIFIDQLDCLPLDMRLDRHDLRVGKNVIDIKDLANKIKKPIFLLHQMNRKSDENNNANKLFYLKDSAVIEQKADVVIFLNPRQNEEDGFSETIDIVMTVAKNRMGKTGRKTLSFNRKRGIFNEHNN